MSELYTGADEWAIKVSHCAAHMYHCAEKSISTEWRAVCFRQLERVIDFERAIWISHSTSFDLEIYHREYFNFDDLGSETENSEFAHDLITSPFFPDIFRFGGIDCYPMDMSQQQLWQGSDFYRRYGAELALEHLLIIGFDHVERGAKEVIFLFRRQLEDFFTRQDIDICRFLLPHLVEIVQFSHIAVKHEQIIRKHRCQAICAADGQIVEMGSEFRRMLPSRFWAKEAICIDFIEACIDDNVDHVEVEGVRFNVKLIDEQYFVVAIRDEDLLSALTKTEKEVAVMMGRGVATKSIAELLGSAVRTVEKHQASIYKKLGTKNKAETVGLLGSYKG